MSDIDSFSSKARDDDDELRLIDDVCDRFEAELRDGRASQISEYLTQVPPQHASTLLRELLLLIQEVGVPGTLADYVRELPEHEGTIRDVLGATLIGDPLDDSTQAEGATREGAAVQVESVEQSIGPYQLLHQIGEGGMGSVYEAQQLSPVQRRVALKVIKSGLDSKAVVARFEAERQALALMDHTSIARILDAGTTVTGQPYFAMELVPGIPITDYCDRHQLSVKERIAIFIEVCHAVQHAHQKGIIHRDLKPNNILVAEYDGRPTPKIIDFGLAKATQAGVRLTDKSMYTEFGQVIGTLLYMSPEQASANPLDIDTRADIFALGVILFEILTGSTPLKRDALRTQSLLQALEMVREQTVPRPSQRLSEEGNTVDRVLAERNTDVRRLSDALSGDLDWIVLRAADKDRSRRYTSASALADDLGRFLAHEAVEARPPSAVYLASKFVRKHRGLVASCLAIASVLLIAVFTSAWFASEARARAAEANEKRQLAEQLAGRNQAIVDIYAESFASTNPTNDGVDYKMSAKQVLLNARTLLERLNEDPDGQAKLLASIAESLLQMGEFTEAIACCEQVQALYKTGRTGDLRKVLECSTTLGICYRRTDQLRKAITCYEEALELAHPALPNTDPVRLVLLNNLAYALMTNGKLNEARELFEEKLALQSEVSDRDPDKLFTLHNLAALNRNDGRPERAIELLLDVIEKRMEVLGPVHPDTLNSQDELAGAYHEAGQADRAIELLRKILLTTEDKLGPTHPDTQISSNNLGLALLRDQQFDAAISVLESSIEKFSGILPESSLLSTRNNLANAYSVVGRHDEAISMHEQIVADRRENLDASHPHLSSTILNLGMAYQQAGEVEDALPYLEEAVQLRSEYLRHEDKRTVLSKYRLGSLYTQLERIDDAVPLLEEALDDSAALGNLRYMIRSVLGRAYCDKADYQAALELLSPFEAEVREAFATKSRDQLPFFLSNLGRAHVGLGSKHFDQAKKCFEEAYSLFDEISGPNHKTTQATVQLLVDLHLAWHDANPDENHDEQAERWSKKLIAEP